MDAHQVRDFWLKKLGKPALESTSSEPQERSYRSGASDQSQSSVAPLPRTGPNETLGLIGSGGMGDIFRARQAELEREIALKKLKHGQDSPRSRATFLAEAVVTGQLEHPNIVPVYALGVDKDDQVCLSMKLVVGENWKTLIRDTRKGDLLFHLETLLQVCNAVAYAHSKSIIHNDLKPANVMVGPFGEVTVLDWGLAVSVRPTNSKCSRVRHRTSICSPVGTPAYMAPELAQGQGGKLGPWTDIYLLGAILFEILHGKPPHRRPKLYDAIQHALRGELPPIGADVPPELRAICERSLAPRPGDRYQTVQALQAELRRFLRHRESLELTARARQQLEECCLRAAEPELLEATERDALYADFATTVASFDQAKALWEENPDAAQGEERARLSYASTALRVGDLGLAAAQVARMERGAPVTEALRGKISAALAAKVKEARTRRLLTRAVALAGLAAITILAIGLVLVEQKSQQEEAEKARALVRKDYADRRGEIAQEALNEIAAQVQTRLIDEPGHSQAQGAARDLLQVALHAWQDLLETNLAEAKVSRGTATARLRVGELLLDAQGDLSEAARELEAARGLFDTLFAQTPADLSLAAGACRALHNLGRLAELRGDFQTARTLLEDCRERYLQLLGHDGPAAWRAGLARCCASLGRVLQALGNNRQAHSHTREALDLDRVLADEDPLYRRDLANDLEQLAGIAMAGGRFAEATELYARCLAQHRALLSEDSTRVRVRLDRASGLRNLGEELFED